MRAFAIARPRASSHDTWLVRSAAVGSHRPPPSASAASSNPPPPTLPSPAAADAADAADAAAAGWGVISVERST
eukprot:5690957-Prymnesium_polylepis.1